MTLACCDESVSTIHICIRNTHSWLCCCTDMGTWQGVAHRALFTGGCSVAVTDAAALEKLLLDADSCKRR